MTDPAPRPLPHLRPAPKTGPFHELLRYPRDLWRVVRFCGRTLILAERVLQAQFHAVVWLLVIATAALVALRTYPQVAAMAPFVMVGLSALLQIGFVMAAMIFQFVGLMWFLSRPRMYWIMPEGGNELGLSFDDYRGNPELVRLMRLFL